MKEIPLEEEEEEVHEEEVKDEGLVSAVDLKNSLDKEGSQVFIPLEFGKEYTFSLEAG